MGHSSLRGDKPFTTRHLGGQLPCRARDVWYKQSPILAGLLSAYDRFDMTAIRTATAADWPAIWPIFRAVISAGDTHVNSPDTPEVQAHAYWVAGSQQVYVTVDGEVVVGTYRIRPNQPDLGSHVANAGFMVAPGREGRGIGRAMAEDAMREAKRMGYRAMQFNFVISSNVRAVRLWRSLGFVVIGTQPDAFRHARLGFVDALIMYRAL